ncbi:MAG TPA: hypothetical protein VE404_00330 [Verrucomicrobiae bacterium]|nr:hypothetical protein [Verrucomicrobiae bacterium]
MTCDEARELFDHPAARPHLEACAACRDEAADVRALSSAAAALPESIEPPTDLWRKIDAKLESRVVRLPAAVRAPARRFRLAAAAAAVIAIAGAAYVAIVIGVPGRTETAVPSPAVIGIPETVPAGRAVPSPAAIPTLGGADIAFIEARQQLRAALYERRKSFSPETVRTVDRNLKLIEGAIEEIRTAVARDPGNRELQKMLIATRQREVALLQHVTQTADLRTRTR